MKKYRATEIFVPGGMPQYTYVARTDKTLQERLNMANDNLSKLVTVTGMTKSGKTVLTNRIFPREKSIWVDGGSVGVEDDLWNYILSELDGYTEIGSEKSKESTYGVESAFEGEGKIPFVASAKSNIGGSFDRTRGESQNKSLTLSPRIAAVTQLRKNRVPLIIDDFHYLKRSFQGDVVRALKPLIFAGLPVILIAIPHRRYDAVKVEREMTGRIENLSVPTWEVDELLRIPAEGFPLLNVQVNPDVSERLADEAFGSPHLMQEFCRNLAIANNITETVANKVVIENVSEQIFVQVAEQTGKVIFEKLAKGPRQRTDRVQRNLKNGSTADIYQVVLLALAHLKPRLETVDYETLRASIREILAGNIPQAHEVTRVLEQMSKIAASDEASTPVLDWEKDDQKLHITDPFFAFYLKWGVIE